MPFNVNNFKTSLRDFGYVDNNSFIVYVQPPKVLGGDNPGISKNLSFRIDQVRAPGISLITNDINRYGIGPTQKQPTSAQFQEVNISVLGDYYCEFWQWFYGWERAIFQFNGTTNGGPPNYTAEYKEEYSSTIVIQIFDHFGKAIQAINLFQAFPTAIREFPLSWGDSNLLKINVALAYTEYTIDNLNNNEHRQLPPDNKPNFPPNLAR